MSKQRIQSVRGMNDMLPEDAAAWHFLEKTYANLVHSYGYQEMRTPIVESTDLFKRSIGEVTDIVEKEMYTFEDRNGDSLTLRPEGTASIVRAIIENGLLQQRLKLWYKGLMFRHERPQKGRYRQFNQLGCEVFGLAGADTDAEVIAMTARLWDKLGIKDVELQINSLGSNEARTTYREILISYFSKDESLLDEDSQRRLHSNPLRILDSKNPAMQELIEAAPKLAEHLDEDSKQQFTLLCDLLDAMNISYVINPRLVRGLDYYNKTVFEWVTTKLGAQGTICAGGRYDGLVEQIGGRTTPAFGFAMGAERLLSLIEQNKNTLENSPDIYMVLQGDNAQKQGLVLAEQLHQDHPELNILTNCDGGSFKAQFKRADKSGARLAFVIGEDEVNDQTIVVKYLREDKEQEVIGCKQLPSWTYRK